MQIPIASDFKLGSLISWTPKSSSPGSCRGGGKGNFCDQPLSRIEGDSGNNLALSQAQLSLSKSIRKQMNGKMRRFSLRWCRSSSVIFFFKILRRENSREFCGIFADATKSKAKTFQKIFVRKSVARKYYFVRTSLCKRAAPRKGKASRSRGHAENTERNNSHTVHKQSARRVCSLACIGMPAPGPFGYGPR